MQWQHPTLFPLLPRPSYLARLRHHTKHVGDPLAQRDLPGVPLAHFEDAGGHCIVQVGLGGWWAVDLGGAAALAQVHTGAGVQGAQPICRPHRPYRQGPGLAGGPRGLGAGNQDVEGGCQVVGCVADV